MAATGLFGRVGEFHSEKETFTSYVERMEMFFMANGIVERNGEGQAAANLVVRERKRAIFLTEIGPEVYSTLSNLLVPVKPKDTPLSEIIQALEKHYNPPPLEIAESFHFGTRHQKPGESVHEFIVALKKLSIHCNYGEFLGRALRDRFVCGLSNTKIQNKLLNTEELTFERACQIAKSMEMVEQKTQEFHPTIASESDHSGGTLNELKTEKENKDKYSCYRCGGKHAAHSCSSRDIGASLTKMVLRHKSIEGKLKALIGLLYDSLISPLQSSLDDWKRGVNQLDRDHAKEYKKCKQEMKKITAETVKWQKKVKKGKTENQERLDAAVKQANMQLAAFEDQERKYLRKVLIEERSRYCTMASCVKTVVEQEVSMLSEIEHLESLLADIVKQTYNPAALPIVGEDLVRNLRLSDHSSGSWDDEQTPPPSPTNTAVRTPAHPTAPQMSTSPVHNNIRDPPTTPPPPPPSEKDAYYDAFSRHYSFSAKHSSNKGRVQRPKLNPLASPKKHHTSMRSSSFSISSNSSYSSMSSLGSSLGSPSTESLPQPPPPLPAQHSMGSVDHLPPPPFPGVPAAQDQAGHPQNDRSSWMTADSGCCSSSSGERSPSTSMGQVYCPSTVPEYPPEETTISGHQYATPFVTSPRNRCMSESASSHLQGRVHRRSDSEASSQSSYYSGGSDVTSIVSSDSGYFGQGQGHPHPEWQKENSAPASVSPQKQRTAFNRSQSVSGRPSAAQAAQLAVLASHAARSRSAPMPPVRKSSVPPPCPDRIASLLSEEENEDAQDENVEEPSLLLKQIQMQRQAIKSKSKANAEAVNQS